MLGQILNPYQSQAHQRLNNKGRWKSSIISP